MSEDRMDELGLPRRAFMKRAAAAVFAAPVIVSFGFAGIAEACCHSCPNQTNPNQTNPNQTQPDGIATDGPIVSGQPHHHRRYR